MVTEREVDRYVRRARGVCPDYPAHPQRYFREQDRRHNVNQLSDSDQIPDDQTIALLRHIIVTTAHRISIEYPRLSRASDAFRRKLEGDTCIDIGRALGVHPSTARRNVRRVLGLVVPMIRDEEIWLVSGSQITPAQIWWLLVEIFGADLVSLAGYDKPS